MDVAAAQMRVRSLLRCAMRWSGTREGKGVLTVLGLALAIRVLLAPWFQIAGDQQAYIYWGAMMRHHFLDFYSYAARNPDWRYAPQYPPLAMYIVCVTDSIYVGFAHLFGISSLHTLITIMKVPAILADLGAVALLYWVSRQVLPYRWALALAAVYAFLPAVLVDGALWGQTDAIITLPMLAALVLVLRQRVVWAGALMGLAIMFKPQPVILVPVLLVYAWRWQGWRAALHFLLSLMGSALVVWLPYLIPPHPEVLVYPQVLALTVNSWPAASPNAYNLWLLLGWNAVDYRSPILGPFSLDVVGLTLFGVITLIVLAGVIRDSSPVRLFAGAGLLATAFFDVAVLQHERYLFPAMLLLLAATALQFSNVWFFIGVSTTAFLNMLVPILLYSPLGLYAVPFSTATWEQVVSPVAHRFTKGIALVNVVLLVSMVVAYVYSLWRNRRDQREVLARTGAAFTARDSQRSAPFRAAATSEGPNLMDSMIDKSLSVVIPCYNEQDNIRPMYERLAAVLGRLTRDYELVFVNNGSYDGSAAIFDQLAASDPHVSILTLSRNFDSQGAYTAGMEYASGDAVICIDGDIQDPPELIPAFVAKWLEGYQVVYGERVRRKGSLVRRIGYKAFYRLFRRLSYIDIPVDAGDFSLMDRAVVSVMNAMPERNRFIRGLRAWAGFRQTGIPYVREDRHAGRSTNSILDLFRWASLGLVSFSYAPLELISYLAGGVVALSALALVVYTVLYFVFPSSPRGFQTLLVIILFLGGIQLLCLSIIGAYLGKIFEEIKGRPKYIIQHIHNDHRAPAPYSVHESGRATWPAWQELSTRR